jgi:virginiamycin A acetyltransferase
MGEMPIYKRALLRLGRILTGNKGVYCKKGIKNHVAGGTILYEPCTIGSYNYFAPYTLAYNAIIGNYCSIGPGCRLGLADHDIHAISTRAMINNGAEEMELFDYEHPTVIGSDVWLGANVVVKQGIHIGNGAVIGANAVVTKNIPPYAIAVGIPAKVKSYRFDEEKREKLLKSEWYQLEPTEAKKTVQKIRREIGGE